MTDIEQKALALLNEVRKEQGYPPAKWDSLDVEWLTIETIGRAIEQHEAAEQELSDYKQKVSDAVEGFMIAFSNGAACLPSISHLVIPAPKPDPLVDVMKDLSWDEETAAEDWATDLRAALEARGLQIVEKNDD